MFNKTIFSNLESFINSLSTSPAVKKLALNISKTRDDLIKLILNLSGSIDSIESSSNLDKHKTEITAHIIPLMKEIRSIYDEIEKIIPERFEPFPTYNTILY